MAKTWIWISGWAIYPDQFRSAVELALPEDSHQVLAPTPDALERVLASGADRIGGYSLGSLILLSALEQIPEVADITCLAPFISFCKEDQLGGTTPKATLQTLQKRLQKQPAKTLQLFYRLAGLSHPLAADRLPYPIEHLEWGLEQLATLQVKTTLLGRAKAIVGLTDPLIEEKEMRSKWSTCHFINECDHDYRRLLVALSDMGTL
ncbi:MAG: hypothetical protein ACJAT5_000652 [Lentimonas sp.]|jgi:hypothetical protein